MTKVLERATHAQEDVFVKQCPFPVVPTNLKGAYAIPAPPRGFDPTTATAEELVQHGVLWRRPTALDNPQLVNAWKRLFSRDWSDRHHVIPEHHPQHGKTHLRKNRTRQANQTSLIDLNWAGAVLTDGGPWNTAVGVWNVPFVAQPNAPQSAQGGWDSSSWIGIDGFGGSNDVLQAGVEQSVDPAGRTAYTAWFEWFAPQTPASPSYIFQTNISNIPVNPGNEILCAVAYMPIGLPGGPKLGHIQLVNLSTGHVVSEVLLPPPGASFSGNSAEWIVEAPDGGLPDTQLPFFTPVQFTNAAAVSASGVGGNPNDPNATIVNIAPSPAPLTTVHTGLLSVTVEFI